MRKIFLILMGLAISLVADSNSSIEKFMFYKTMDSSLTLDEIKTNKYLFIPITNNVELITDNMTSWIKVKLKENISSGKYLTSYQGFEFNVDSFTREQKMTKYIDKQTQVYSFEYNKDRDSKFYYFKLLQIKHYKSPLIKNQLFSDYYRDDLMYPDSREYFLLFGIIIGFILMVGLYNLAIFYFTNYVSFLYYSMMQFFMIFIMIYQFGISSLDMFLYNSAVIISSILATQFMRTFLNTSKYLFKWDLILRLYIVLLILDFFHLLINDYSLFSFYGLYGVFGLIYFIIGILRLKQGFVPAKFFLIGWSFLIMGIIATEHIGSIYGLSPLLFASPIESIFLSMAISYKLKLSLDEKKEQEDLLVHQSKLATLGEMIGNISHQLKQPLTYLSYNFMNLREASKRDLLDDKYLNKKLDKANSQLEFMSQTIDNFKDFYIPNKTKALFSLEEASIETIEIMSYQFLQQGIEVDLNVMEDGQINSYKNEYKQVLLNLLTNAKDIFEQRKILKPKVNITIKKNMVLVEDNAGGISKEIINCIYEPYFSTKKGNSGIGLYMSKMIIEKDMEGVLSVENSEEGAKFKIIF